MSTSNISPQHAPPPGKPPGRRLMPTRAAADYVSVATATLERWRYSGKGPRFYRLSGAVRYDQADLDAWIDSNARASTSDRGQDLH